MQANRATRSARNMNDLRIFIATTVLAAAPLHGGEVICPPALNAARRLRGSSHRLPVALERGAAEQRQRGERDEDHENALERVWLHDIGR